MTKDQWKNPPTLESGPSGFKYHFTMTCVATTLGQLQNFSESPRPTLLNGDNNVCIVAFLWSLNDIVYMNQYQIHASCLLSKNLEIFSQHAEFEYILNEYSLWLGTVLEALCRLPI